MTALYDHEDAAYAADAEGSQQIGVAAGSSRQRSTRNREFSLYASRLRHHDPSMKRDVATTPLRLDTAAQSANGYSSSGDEDRLQVARSSRSPRSRAILHDDRSPVAENFDNYDDEEDDRSDRLDDAHRPHHDHSPASATSATSPFSFISPRWASLAHSVTSAPTAASTAATSPRSPPPKTFHPASPPGSRPQSPASLNRFLGLSSHPFIADSSTPDRSSASTLDSPVPSIGKAHGEKKDKKDRKGRKERKNDSKRQARHALPPLAITTSIPGSAPASASDLPSPVTSLASEAMLVGNFSRPRMASVSRGSRDVLSPPSTWPQERARGMSVSSNKSASTFSSVAQRPSNDQLHTVRLVGPATAAQIPPPILSPGLPRPPAIYSRIDSMDSMNSNKSTSNTSTHNTPTTHPSTASATPTNMHARDPLPWIADEAMRSSYRSQLTASTAQGTLFTTTSTERSSVLTKTSSRTTLSWYANTGMGGDDGLSVEDVMGLYEKGFADSTGAEDNDAMTDAEGPMIPGPTLRSQVLADDGLPLAAPPPIGGAVGKSPFVVRDSGSFFRNSGLPSSLHNADALSPVVESAGAKSPTDEMKAEEAGMAPVTQRKKREKRDSAKMLEREERAKAQPPVVVGLAAETDRRPASSKSSSVFCAAPTAEPEDPAARDRYGFRKYNQYITREQYDAWNGPYSEYINRRRRKWVTYLKDSGLMTDNPNRFPPPSVKTKRFIRKGIPPEWRGAAWFYYAGGPSIVAKHPGIYDYLIQRVAAGEAKDVDIEAVERDLHRTFPDNVAFQFPEGQQPGHGDNRDAEGGRGDVVSDRPEEPAIVSKLRRVLLAFSVYNPRIGYCQSLNFLAGLLLLFVETEEQCFWLLNVITRIYLPGTHEMSLEGSKVDLSVLMTALQDSLPGVWAKIGGDLDEGAGHPGMHGGRTPGGEAAKNGAHGAHGTLARRMKLPKMGRSEAAGLAATSVERLPPITLCMTAWFMSCFIGTLPIETTLRVWDIFFYEGSKTLFRVALAVFKMGEGEIRAVSDPMEMFGVVQGLPRRLLDCNMVMEATFRRRNGFGHLSQENIEERRREQRDVLKEARRPATAGSGRDGAGAAGTSTTAGAVTDGEHDALSAEVRRKGTLFGRRRDRRVEV